MGQGVHASENQTGHVGIFPVVVVRFTEAKDMTIPEAEAEYKRLLSRESTKEERQKAWLELMREGRASGYYRPARGLLGDDIDDEKEPYP